MGQHYPAAQWSFWIEDQACSGQSISSYCASIGISAQSFYRWRRKFQQSESPSADLPPLAAASFVPVRIHEDQIEIELPGNALARVANRCESLRPLIQVLAELESDR